MTALSSHVDLIDSEVLELLDYIPTSTNGTQVTDCNIIEILETEVEAQGYFQIGRWQLMEGANSHDFYIKDSEQEGYYRLGKTEQRIRLDSCIYGSCSGGCGCNE